MNRFTAEEIEYLQSQRLGRMATVNEKGDLHVVPVGFRYNPEHDTIDIGGHNIVPTKKYRDALRHRRVAFVVDDVLPPWKPRLVEVRGTVQAEPSGARRSGIDHQTAVLIAEDDRAVCVAEDENVASELMAAGGQLNQILCGATASGPIARCQV